MYYYGRALLESLHIRRSKSRPVYDCRLFHKAEKMVKAVRYVVYVVLSNGGPSLIHQSSLSLSTVLSHTYLLVCCGHVII